MDIKSLLQLTVERNASDLHLVAGFPPALRVEGVLFPVPNEAVLTPMAIAELLKEYLRIEIINVLTKYKEVDFSLSFSEKARFRVNAYTEKASWAAAFRRIPLEIPTIDSLRLPKILHTFTNLRQGFILVTGPTGHGKSTTLAATIQEINQNRATHVVTVEDPIEFVFRPVKSIISQREMDSDTLSWEMALRSALREDPDVVLIGEMRDFKTMSAALTIAETGHLVFATLHTNSAAQSIDRIVDVFPEEQQAQIKLQLSNVIEAVLSQRLIPGADGKRYVAYELMLGTTAIKTVIREGKTHQIDNIIQTSQEIGMVSLEQSLSLLIREGKISMDTALSYSLRPDELKRLIKNI